MGGGPTIRGRCRTRALAGAGWTAARLPRRAPAAPGDGRRDDDGGRLADGRRRGGVLDDLDDLVPVHDGAGGDAEVLAHGEGAAIHLAGQPAGAPPGGVAAPERAGAAGAGG